MDASKQSVLIVEDEQSLRTALAESFSRAGFDVRTAFDGMEGVRAVKKLRPDLIVLDLLMPELNGRDMMRQLHEWDKTTKDIPVIVLTNVDTANAVVLKEVGNDPSVYLTKSNQNIENVIKEALKLLKGDNG